MLASGLSEVSVVQMALVELEKGTLSLLRAIESSDAKVASSESVTNAVACCLALSAECKNDDFFPRELERCLHRVHTILTCKTCDVRDLVDVLTYVEEYETKAEDERDDGALMQFLVQHKQGKAIVAWAAMVLEGREHEGELQRIVDELGDKANPILNMQDCDFFVSPDSGMKMLDSVHALEASIAEVTKSKKGQKGLTPAQLASISGKVGAVWEHVGKMLSLSLRAAWSAALELVVMANRHGGLVDHPTAEEGKTIKGSISLDEVDKVFKPAAVLDHAVWGSVGTPSSSTRNAVAATMKSVSEFGADVSAFVLSVLCKHEALAHLRGGAPEKSQVAAWAAIAADKFQQVVDGVSPGCVQDFVTEFGAVAKAEGETLQQRVYDHVKAIIGQVASKSYGGITGAVKDGLLKGLPGDGPANHVLSAFLEASAARRGVSGQRSLGQ